jgi:Rtr1/RPAP2 family
MGTCGWPLCGEKILSSTEHQAKFRISLREHRIYERTESSKVSQAICDHVYQYLELKLCRPSSFLHTDNTLHSVNLRHLHVTQQYCNTDCQIAAVTWAAALPAMSPYTRPEALAHAAEAAARAVAASGSTAHSHPSASPPPARAYKRARRKDGKPPTAPTSASASAGGASGLSAVQQQLERMDISSEHGTPAAASAVIADRKGASGLTAVQQQLERMDISSDHSATTSAAAVTADKKGASERSKKSEYCCCLLYRHVSYHLPKQLPYCSSLD